MQKKKTYAVFGLGRYGIAVAKELVGNGMEVIAVDSDQKLVNDAAAYLSSPLPYTDFFCRLRNNVLSFTLASKRNGKRNRTDTTKIHGKYNN